MYAISYRFKLTQSSAEAETQFITCWSGITEFFNEKAGALGSRLHKGEDGCFYAYAQWPDRQTFEAASEILPTESFVKLRLQWAQLCEPSEIIFAGTVKADLLDVSEASK